MNTEKDGVEWFSSYPKQFTFSLYQYFNNFIIGDKENSTFSKEIEISFSNSATY